MLTQRVQRSTQRARGLKGDGRDDFTAGAAFEFAGVQIGGGEPSLIPLAVRKVPAQLQGSNQCHIDHLRIVIHLINVSGPAAG